MRENLVNTQMYPFFHPRWRGFVPCRRDHGRDNGRKKRRGNNPLERLKDLFKERIGASLVERAKRF
jgi:hypothetical protein